MRRARLAPQQHFLSQFWGLAGHASRGDPVALQYCDGVT